MNRKALQAVRDVAKEIGTEVSFEEGQKHTITTFRFAGRFVDINLPRNTTDEVSLKRMLRKKLQ